MESRHRHVYQTSKEVGNQEDRKTIAVEGMQDSTRSIPSPLDFLFLAGGLVEIRQQDSLDSADDRDLVAVERGYPKEVREVCEAPRYGEAKTVVACREIKESCPHDRDRGKSS